MNGPDAGLGPKPSSCKPDGRSLVELCDAPLAGAGNPNDGTKQKPVRPLMSFFQHRVQ
jgi:hypothetical protein